MILNSLIKKTLSGLFERIKGKIFLIFIICPISISGLPISLQNKNLLYDKIPSERVAVNNSLLSTFLVFVG